MIETAPYDSAEFLTDDTAIAEYMNTALETGDTSLIAHAVGVVARAKNMAAIARDTGLSRGTLYRSLSAEGHPELGTVIRVLDSIGFNLQAVPRVKIKINRKRQPQTAKAAKVAKAGKVLRIAAPVKAKASAKGRKRIPA